ncbi:hypothetical protein C1H46_042290 [Malus baccata]|uniref:Uncharacterized protein n=1 Tax=Malus baccata TaxID=106549 RepID=A0A540KDA5_MALBA|nr:hypothetical protein C1H46_042290 [Malus baccata]
MEKSCTLLVHFDTGTPPLHHHHLAPEPWMPKKVYSRPRMSVLSGVTDCLQMV